MVDLSQFLDKNVQVTLRNNLKETGWIRKNGLHSSIYPYIFRGGMRPNTGYFHNGRVHPKIEEHDADIVHIEEITPMVNLSRFLGKDVQVTLRNGCVVKGKVSRNGGIWDTFTNPYLFHQDTHKETGYSNTYTADGFYHSSEELFDKDIVHIEELKPIKPCEKMTTKKELQDRITEVESQLLKLRQELADFKDFPKIGDAKVGDELEDGSIVIYNSSGVAIVIAPKSTECRSKWSRNLSLNLRNCLESKGFQPNQWFIPDVKQLNCAMLAVPEQFEKTSYWSSDILTSAPTEWVEHRVGFPLAVCFPRNGKAGSGYTLDKSMVLYVRAFRCIFH